MCWRVHLYCSIAKQSGTYKALQRPAGQEESRMCCAATAYKVIWKMDTRREGSWIWVALDCQAPSMCSLKVGAAPGPKPAGICRTKSQAWMCIAVMVHQLSGGCTGAICCTNIDQSVAASDTCVVQYIGARPQVKCDMNTSTQLRKVHLAVGPTPMQHP